MSEALRMVVVAMPFTDISDDTDFPRWTAGFAQADNVALPLVRRRARIRRPPRLRMRMRNPWVFFLLRLFG